MTIHYHGLPIYPDEVLRALTGKHFCVSFSNYNQVEIAHEISQSIMHDNGAFSVWRKTRRHVTDWTPFYEWVEPKIFAACHWAVIPDVIDGREEQQDLLVSQWPFGCRGAPVWHLNESLERLLSLADCWPRVCFGSTAEYQVVGSDNWKSRVDKAFKELSRRHRLLPWIHMLRGMQTVKLNFPFASVDSSDVGRNWHRGLWPSKKPGLLASSLTATNEVARLKLESWDARQCPSTFVTQYTDDVPGFFL